jgi:hypothetical protein
VVNIPTSCLEGLVIQFSAWTPVHLTGFFVNFLTPFRQVPKLYPMSGHHHFLISEYPNNFFFTGCVPVLSSFIHSSTVLTTSCLMTGVQLTPETSHIGTNKNSYLLSLRKGTAHRFSSNKGFRISGSVS